MDVIKEFKKEEKVIEQAVKKSIFSKSWFKSVLGIVVISLLFAFFVFWRITAGQIKTDNASVVVPIINLTPTISDTLEEIYVKVGDTVLPNTPVAKVGNEIITTKVGGIIVSINHQEGQIFNSNTPVVSMINPDQERVVAKIDENKGLKDIKVGQPVVFTVDAFGSKQYQGLVDEISPISDESGIVFNISDKRETKQFDVKIRFNTKNYPELRDGMSAKITIFTN